MQRFVLFFVTGILLLTRLVELPDERLCWLVVPLCLFAYFQRRWIWLLGLPAGFLFALFQAHQLNQFELPHDLQGINVVVSGTVVEVPQGRDGDLSFTLKLDSWDIESDQRPDKVRLSWYRGAPDIIAGDRWQLTVRLKRPHGYMNLGGVDREKFLFHQGIQATGYVRDQKPHEVEQNQRLGQASYSLNRSRQQLAIKIQAAIPESAVHGPLLALTLGLRDQMTDTQWDTFRQTGTTHLMAISGLHVGLVSGLMFWLVRRLWSRSARACLAFPALKAAAVASLLAALLYAAMSGFAIPAQRASIMVAIVAMTILTDRKIFPGYLLATAMLVILLLDCFAVISAGFWMSFAAVAALLFVLNKDPSEQRSRQWFQIQILLAFALFPLSIWFFQQSSIISPLVNLVAVPITGLVIVPIILFGAVLLLLVPPLGKWVLSLGEWLLDLLVRGLEFSSTAVPAMITLPKPDAVVLMLALIGMLVLLAPRVHWSKVAGVVLLLPLLLNRPPDIPVGEFRVDVLDVGQGSAYVVQTNQHVMIFDPGPRYAADYEAGSAIVTPYLRARGVRSVDRLMVSHADDDHIGGLQGVLDNFPVTQVSMPDPDVLPALDAVACQRDQQWQWDGLTFTVLNPPPEFFHGDKNRNNGSCVLHIAGENTSMLFTGDIEKGAERTLLQSVNDLMVDVITVPHHGSKTSSTEAFLKQLRPQLAIVSAGYRNSFGHPKAEVLARYADHQIEVLETTQTGMLTLHFRHNGDIDISQYRKAHRRYWHRN